MAWSSSCHRGFMRKAVPQRTHKFVTLPILLQFLLTFAQGQGQGTSTGGNTQEAAIPPVDENVAFQISEELPIGSPVGTIPTRDGLEYRFPEEPQLFALNSVSGEITTKVVIDRESLSTDSFDLFVQSMPSARHFIEVHITILDINDNSPVFEESSIQMSYSENDQPATEKILDTAMDSDIGVNDVTTNYQIISGNEEHRFELVMQTAVSGQYPYLYLKNTVKLDREEKDFYRLVIQASDGGSPPRHGYLTVNINVTDTNDNHPLFDHSDYSVTVNETIPVHSAIINVTATDLDIGPNGDITYIIFNDDLQQFAVDPKTGVVTTLQPLNCDRSCSADALAEGICSPKSCVIIVEAHDSGEPSPLTGRAYITVTLIDENNHDPSISIRYSPSSSPYAVVDEGSSQNSVVAIVSVTDQDEGANGETTVVIIRGNEMNHFFLDTASGLNMILVNGPLDRERISKYNLTIEARDMGVPQRSSTAHLVIMVNDVNDHQPIFLQPSYNAELSERVPVGSFVASVTATDNDTGINAEISYAIYSGDTLDWFRIDENTGLVTTNKELDHEQKSALILTIRAQDGAANPYKSYTNLTITIMDENDEVPTFSQSEYVVVMVEGTSANTEIITLTAVDRDQGLNGTVRYSFDTDVDVEYPGMFRIDSISGRMTLLQELDREQNDLYQLRVKANDQGQPALSSTTTVLLNVTDINDNSPLFYPVQYYAHVLENQPVSTSVVQVLATDADAGNNGVIHFRIDSGSDQKFVIDMTTGWIRTNAQLDREEKSLYTLTVSATDMAGRMAVQPAIVEVTVNDIQDTPPSFRQPSYAFDITEDSSSNFQVKTVGQVLAYTQDTAGVITYAISGGDPESHFTINENNGVITTTKIIDREEAAFYSLTVVAHGGNMFGLTTVNITILDINDNSPSFGRDSGEAYVVENWPVGHDVYLADAVDPDYGYNSSLIYVITTSSSNLFQVDASTGLISLAHSVSQSTASSFTLTVKASDGGNPSRFATLDVTIYVSDVNDNTPQFEQSSYTISINESRPVNDRIFRVTAIDGDTGQNGEVLYSILTGNYNNNFGIFPDGVLYIASALDREIRDSYVLNILAQDGGVEPRSTRVNLTIHILDSNDNSPSFTNDTYIMQVIENSPVDTYIGSVFASDADIGQNSEISYNLEGEQEKFAVHTSSGAIVTRMVFDREEMVSTTGQDTISLTVVASDHGESSLHDEAVVQIKIIDANDNAPQFLNDVYEPSLYEIAEINTQVVKVSATDADIGSNAVVGYSIINGNERGDFMIDDLTGQIRLVGQLDRETTPTYALTVMAEDEGDAPLNTTIVVHVTILDNNDNAPVFTEQQKTLSVIETALQQTYISQVTATDADIANNALITYSIAGGNDRNTFHIEGSTGKIYLANTLDFEWKQRFTLNITATDFGSPPLSSSMTCVVNVLDYNDNAPYFQQAQIVRQIAEGVQVGTSITIVTANDPDSGINGELKYEIVRQEPSDNHFTIDPYTGQITTMAAIDREFTDNFLLTVRATDQAQPESARRSAEKNVTVIILDVNDNAPLFVSMNAVAVSQGASANSLLMTMKAIDEDQGTNGVVTYSIVGGDTARFRVNTNSGALYLQSYLSSQIHSYNLTIKAEDQGVNDARTARTDVTVFVRSDSQNGPTFAESDYNGEVYENEPPGTSILTVNAVSSTGNPVEYYITGISSLGVSQYRYFQIDRLSGIISTWQQLDLELGYKDFTIEVYAVDMSSSSPKTRTTQVRITLLDRNDSPPIFSRSIYNNIQVTEDVTPGYVVMTIEATDADQDGTLQYDISSGDDDNNFAIDPVRGELRVINPLDRERQASYSLHIVATDGVQSSEAIVNIVVADVNDQSPQFLSTSYSFEVAENAMLGTTIGQVIAIDADSPENAEVTYSIVSEWGRDRFALTAHSGVFTLMGTLDYEQIPHFVLTIKAEDSGVNPLSTEVTVYMNVIDINDNAPTFNGSTYDSNILEDVTVGTSILTVTATDADSGINGDIEYSITGGDPAGRFTVERLTGVVQTAKLLDRETQGFYTLTVTATDTALPASTRLSGSTVVRIILSDANDNAPEFISPTHVTVPENSDIGSSVFRVIANDADEGRNSYVEYSLSVADQAMFSIGSVDGIVRVRTLQLDRETQDEYELHVIATDTGTVPKSSTMTLTVSIGDENDNAPVFTPSYYNVTLIENALIGSHVLTVSANDQDAGINAEIRYSIADSDSSTDFRLDSHTGELFIQNGLDYERKTSYRLTVIAQDLGDPHRSDSALINIAITDINDNAPEFVNSPYVAYVQENIFSPSPVVQISARDMDGPPFNTIIYSITEGEKSTFAINSNTGQVSTLKTLDREDRSLYKLIIKAMDTASPRLSSTATLTILVEDANDNTPIMLQPNLVLNTARVPENSPASTFVFQAIAMDLDTGNNALIRYSLSGSSSGQFSINPSTGVIATTTVLDREQQDSHNLMIIAKDSGLLQRSAMATLVVTVEDLNDNQPQFTQQQYSTYIKDPTSAGQYVLGATAIDADIGSNGEIEYTLFGGDSSIFDVMPSTGVITAKQTLSGIPGSYQFFIRATDKGSDPQSSEVTVQVSMLPSSTSGFPVFSLTPPTIQLSESRSVGDIISTVQATTQRPGVTLSYYIAGGNVGEVFTVNPTTGQISVAQPLDAELTSSYELWLEARDNGSPQLSDYIKLTITIIDQNDNSPVFDMSLYNITVGEEEYPPISVVTVEATDLDSGENGRITYSLAGGNVGNAFTIGDTTGRIITQVQLNREEIDHYILQVQAVDHGTPQRTSLAVVDITVLDKNDEPPVFTQHFHTHIAENSPIGMSVLKITSNDADIGNNALHTYSFTSNPGEKFQIDSISGEVTVAGELDYEIKDEYILRVAANDLAYNIETTVSIYIDDVNDNSPIFDESTYFFSVTEQLPVDTLVGVVHATDFDSSGINSDVFYIFRTSTKLFRLDPSQGQIYTREVLTYLTSGNAPSPDNTLQLVVEVTDRGEPALSSEVTVTIAVEPASQSAVTFTESPYVSAAPETVSIGATVLQIEASTWDDAELAYTIIGGNGTSFFSINQNTGIITATSPLNGQAGHNYSVIVEAKVKVTPSIRGTVTAVIQIAEVNYNTPQFIGNNANYQTTISEDTSISSSIARVTATDSDSSMNGIVSYYIVGGDPAGDFSIDTMLGDIRVAKPLDYETLSTYHLNISAKDRGLLPLESFKIFTVYLSDVNDNPPIFNQSEYDAYIQENSPSGLSVYQMNATDPDSASNGVIEYYLTGTSQVLNKFIMDKNTGIIRSQGSIDYEQEFDYKLTVRAINPGTSLSSTTTVNVHVVSVNEFIPEFRQSDYQFMVSESDAIGHVIGSVTATDADIGEEGVIYYYLIGDSNLQGFLINHNTGIIRVAEQVDRESVSQIALQVMAKNIGPIYGNNTDTCQVLVIVEDANDPPLFKSSLYEGNVREDAVSGDRVIQVEATDSDLDAAFQLFIFDIVGGNEDLRFNIDENTGWITTNGGLDRETHPLYMLDVVAIDNGNPPQTGSTTVKVTVTDVNDNGPYFSPANATGHAMENKEPYTQVIISLGPLTSDPDDGNSGNQGPYFYRLIDHLNQFDVGLTSGLVQSKVRLDRETVPEYDIRLQVSDNGSPSMTSTLTLRIIVDDDNDNESQPRPLDVIVFAFEGDLPSGTIANVAPSDPDIIGDYQCLIASGDRLVFSILADGKCNLNVNGEYQEDEYGLTITGSDGVHSSVTSPVAVHFETFDRNTAENSIEIILGATTPAEYLAKHDAFLEAVKSALSIGGTAIMYGIMDNGDNTISVYIAGQNSNGNYIQSNALVMYLKTNEAQIEYASGVNIQTINFDPCSSNVCQNNGECTSEFDIYRDELVVHNGASLVFTSARVEQVVKCQCENGFIGDFCETTASQCLPNPCQNGGTCLEGGACQCLPSFRGDHCEIASKGFQPFSYMEFHLVLDEDDNNIVVEFMSLETSGLLLYTTNGEHFVALEIINKQVRFSFGFGGNAVARMTVPRIINSGNWYRIIARRDGRDGYLWVTECPDDEECDDCSSNSPSCYSRNGTNSGGRLSLGANAVLSIGGIRNFDTILNNLDQVNSHDFIGCVRSFTTDTVDLLATVSSSMDNVVDECPSDAAVTSVCTDMLCQNGGTCYEDWLDFMCVCADGWTGTHCEEVATSFGFGGNSLVKYTVQPSYYRNQVVSSAMNSKRKRRATTETEISLRLRTSATEGILFYSTSSESVSGFEAESTAIQLSEGRLEYISELGHMRATFGTTYEVNDAEWHDIVVGINGDSVSIAIDGDPEMKSFGVLLPDPVSIELKKMSVGGTESDVIIDTKPAAGFEGCLESIKIDNDPLPLSGSTNRFIAEPIGGSDSSCEAILGIAGAAEGLPVAVIVIIVFFIIVLVGIVIGLVLLRWRRQQKNKEAKVNGIIGNKNNAGILDKANNENRSHQDSGYTDGDVSEEAIIQQHIAEELRNQNFNEREITDHLPDRMPSAQPDIIAPEIQTHMSHDVSHLLENGGMDNSGYNDEPPEHYDIDNASSIAPSDLVDVVGHYKRYRSGMLGNNKFKNQSYMNNLHMHPHRYSPGPLGNQPLRETPVSMMRGSPASMLSHRESPNMLAMQGAAMHRQSPGIPGQRVASPLTRTTSPLTVNNVNNLSRTSPMHSRPLSPLNQLSRQSPAVHMPKHSASPMAINSLRSTPVSGLYPSNASSSSATYSGQNIPNSHSRPTSRMKQPINQLALRGTPTRGLTVEDVERLNARPKSAAQIAGTHDAFSSSSEAPSRNIIGHVNYNAGRGMDPAESSSDDGSNDSFTCSEFEYDNDKIRNDFQPNRLLFPKLPETENENDDTDVSRTFTYDGSGSTRDRDSVSTFFNSEDELPKPSNKLLNGALNLDYFLSWGPNFEKLVGVFTDIAELPTTTDKPSGRVSVTLNHSEHAEEDTRLREEYV